MTQQEFLVIAAQFTTQVNVWYTATTPYAILGLTVPIGTNTGANIIGYLQQATNITIQVNESPTEYATLTITQRSLLGQVGAQYYFFNVSPQIIQNAGDEYITPGQIIFTPGIDGPGFQESGYSATQGLAENIRQSDYIMQADRISYISTGAGLPTNMEQLQANTATRAHVQDSLYSDTGWISGRYEGTKLDRLTNSGADPALQGTFFEGAAFSLDTDDNYIQQLQSVGALTYGDYFFSGEGTVPRYVSRETNWYIPTTTISPSTIGSIGLQQINQYKPVTPLSIGDRFNLYRSDTTTTTIPFLPQVIQMVPPNTSQWYPYEIVYNTVPLQLVMIIKKGYNNTPNQTLTGGTVLYKISPIQIFSLEGQLVQPVRQGKFIVKGMDEVLYIDVNGYVIAGNKPQVVVL